MKTSVFQGKIVDVKVSKAFDEPFSKQKEKPKDFNFRIDEKKREQLENIILKSKKKTVQTILKQWLHDGEKE